MKATFGPLIRSGRVKRGWTQRQLAEELELTSGAIAQWERGDIVPSLRHRIILCKLMGIPRRQILPELEWLEAAGLVTIPPDDDTSNSTSATEDPTFR